MNAAFADTFYWIALIDPHDSSNKAVREISRGVDARLVITTDEVLSELLTFCAQRKTRMAAAFVVRKILANNQVRVIPQNRDGFLAGLRLYEARPDKGYSLTDCISMEAMRREGLSDVLTNDRHFEQEGFNALFRN